MANSTKCFIYALTEPGTGWIRYIGKTVRRPRVRLWRHLADPAVNKRCNWLQSLKRRGLRPGLVVLEETTNASACDDERFWIAAVRSTGAALLNMTDGGEGVPGRRMAKHVKAALHKANAGRPLTLEARQKMSEAHRGKVLTDEHKARIGNYWRGRKRSEAWRKNQAAAVAAANLRQEVKEARSRGQKRKWSPEYRQRMGAISRAAWADPEARARFGEALRKAWSDPEARAKRIAKMLATRASH